jgi:hypothetical protein
MAKHVLILCPRFTRAQHELRDVQRHLPYLSILLETAKSLQKTTKWVMQRGILEQLRGANEVLYGPPLSISPAQDSP